MKLSEKIQIIALYEIRNLALWSDDEPLLARIERRINSIAGFDVTGMDEVYFNYEDSSFDADACLEEIERVRATL